MYFQTIHLHILQPVVGNLSIADKEGGRLKVEIAKLEFELLSFSLQDKHCIYIYVHVSLSYLSHTDTYMYVYIVENATSLGQRT